MVMEKEAFARGQAVRLTSSIYEYVLSASHCPALLMYPNDWRDDKHTWNG